ncbi:MAG: hypothetical protein M1549_03520 [Candidatus Dependentiae bacterium]|nr:hypothetical protein [Candidatus Dependentiae bacterium]
MQPSLRKALTSNYIHKLGSLFIGIALWGIVSSQHEERLTITVPLCFYTTQTNACIPSQAPGKIAVTLRGRRAILRQLDLASLAAHVDATKLGASGIIPRITERNLLLPKTIKVVEYRVL